jgi:di/tricarboxylate transporter
MEVFGLHILDWLTIGLVIGKVVLMVKTKLPSDIIGLGIVFILLIAGALPTEVALGCFSSTSVVLVGVLFVLAAALVHSGVVQWISRHILGKPRNLTEALLGIMIPAAGLSAFISSTPVVALMIQSIKVWAKKIKMAPSKLLLPLSYAATMGGVCTLIGTTPNLVISDFYTSHTGEMMSFSSTLIPGIFCLVVGIITIIILQRYLPVRKSPEESFESSADYTVELIVPATSEHIGQTVEEAHLDQVNGGHLIEIVRFDSEVISPVPKDEFILGNDHLVYSGKIDSILELRHTHGLVSANHLVFDIKDIDQRKRKLQMATVDIASPLVGKKMSDINFENRHNVVLVAVAREGKCIQAIPRDIELHPGDTLLLEGAKLLPENFAGMLNFFDSVVLPKEGSKTLISSLIMIGMVALAALRILPLLNSCLIAVMAMLLFRCLSIEQLQNAINWKLLLVFGGSVCLGKAMTYTGVSQLISDLLTYVSGTNALVALIILCLLATFTTEFISSVAAAAIYAPIALVLAESLQANPMTFCVALMISISSSFVTPIGSETNTMVFGPAGYKFADYLKLGLPLTVVILIANIFITTFVFPL